MRDKQRLRARDKKVQKRSRDGLVEHNVTTGESRSVSQKIQDVSFENGRAPDIRAGQGAGRYYQRKAPKAPKQEKKKRRRPIPKELIPSPLPPHHLDDGSTELPPETLNPTHSTPSTPPKPQAPDSPDAPEPARSMPDESGNPAAPVRSARTAERSAPLPEGETGSRPARLTFEDAPKAPPRSKTKRREPEKHPGAKLRYRPDELPPQPAPPRSASAEPGTVKAEGGKGKPRRPPVFSRADTSDASSAIATEQEQSRVRFEPDEGEPHRADTNQDQSTQTGGGNPPSAPETERKPDRYGKKADKALKKSAETQTKLAAARKKLPMRRRLHFNRQPDPESGESARRLHIEKEVKPLYTVPERIAQRLGDTAGYAVHRKIQEAEQENVAVEAAHKAERFIEGG